MAIMSIIHVAAVHWSEQKFIIIIPGAAPLEMFTCTHRLYSDLCKHVAMQYNGLQSETMILLAVLEKTLAVIEIHSQLM